MKLKFFSTHISKSKKKQVNLYYKYIVFNQHIIVNLLKVNKHCQPFKRFYLFIFFREGKGGRKKERNINVWLPLMPPTGDLACNPGMCSDWGLNRRPFDLQVGTQSTEPHQPRHKYCHFSM